MLATHGRHFGCTLSLSGSGVWLILSRFVHFSHGVVSLYYFFLHRWNRPSCISLLHHVDGFVSLALLKTFKPVLLLSLSTTGITLTFPVHCFLFLNNIVPFQSWRRLSLSLWARVGRSLGCCRAPLPAPRTSPLPEKSLDIAITRFVVVWFSLH